MENFKYKLVSPAVMWSLVVIGAVVVYFVVPQGKMFSSSPWDGLVLALGLINWVYVSFVSYRIHKKAPQSVQAIDKLITEGAYAVVRHPMYSADILLAWTVFIYRPSFKILAAVIWLTVVLLFWANLEERMLEEKFIGEYEKYRTRVPMLIPKFWKR